MKLKVLIFLIFISLTLSRGFSIVNGQLSQIGNKYILKVWGTHYERGYAMGYLLAPNIMNVFSNYFYTIVTGANPNTYEYYLNLHRNNFNTDSRFSDEASGLRDGMFASGYSMYHSGLQRNLNLDDILFVNAIVDITGFMNGKDPELGCSSISSWGVSTSLDPQLQGDLVISRLLDWSPNDALLANPLLVIHYPAETDEQKWMSFTYPGLIGALSAITESGSAAFLNMGNIHNHPDPTNLTNVLFDIRKGMERYDLDGDEQHTPEDLFYSLANGHHVGGTIIHSVQQWADSCQAAIIETNNTGTMRRGQDQYSGLNGDNLAATNHFRKLYSPVPCYRYSRMIDSLSVNPQVSAERQLTVLKGAGGVPQNLMLIHYQPSTGQILWSVAMSGNPAYSQTPLFLDAAELWTQQSPVSDELIPQVNLSPQVYPNPLKCGQTLKLETCESIKQVCIYNLKGQIMLQAQNPWELEFELPARNSNLSSGVYFLKAETANGRILTSKFVYLK